MSNTAQLSSHNNSASSGSVAPRDELRRKIRDHLVNPLPQTQHHAIDQGRHVRTPTRSNLDFFMKRSRTSNTPSSGSPTGTTEIISAAFFLVSRPQAVCPRTNRSRNTTYPGLSVMKQFTKSSTPPSGSPTRTTTRVTSTCTTFPGRAGQPPQPSMRSCRRCDLKVAAHENSVALLQMRKGITGSSGLVGSIPSHT